MCMEIKIEADLNPILASRSNKMSGGPYMTVFTKPSDAI